MLVSRNVTISNRRTSIRLEPEMWDGLQEICRRERRTAHEICSMLHRRRRGSSLTAVLRVFIMLYFHSAATEDGHARAGHGDGAVDVGGARKLPRARSYVEDGIRNVARR